jgi:hypothetical protein
MPIGVARAVLCIDRRGEVLLPVATHAEAIEAEFPNSGVSVWDWSHDFGIGADALAVTLATETVGPTLTSVVLDPAGLNIALDLVVPSDSTVTRALWVLRGRDRARWGVVNVWLRTTRDCSWGAGP